MPRTPINLRLVTVRRLAYEASDSGLLSPELAAGRRRVMVVRFSQPAAMVVEGIEGPCSYDSRLAELAELLFESPRAVNESSRAGQARPDGGAKSFRETDADGVEVGRILRF